MSSRPSPRFRSAATTHRRPRFPTRLQIPCTNPSDATNRRTPAFANCRRGRRAPSRSSWCIGCARALAFPSASVPRCVPRRCSCRGPSRSQSTLHSSWRDGRWQSPFRMSQAPGRDATTPLRRMIRRSQACRHLQRRACCHGATPARTRLRRRRRARKAAPISAYRRQHRRNLQTRSVCKQETHAS